MARQRWKGSFLVENRLYAPHQWRRHGRRIQILWRSRHGSAAEGSTERRRKMRPRTARTRPRPSSTTPPRRRLTLPTRRRQTLPHNLPAAPKPLPMLLRPLARFADCMVLLAIVKVVVFVVLAFEVKVVLELGFEDGAVAVGPGKGVVPWGT